jgi:hypothetical protein
MDHEKWEMNQLRNGGAMTANNAAEMIEEEDD